MPSAAQINRAVAAERRAVLARLSSERARFPESSRQTAKGKSLADRIEGRLVAMQVTRSFSSASPSIPEKSGRTVYQLHTAFPNSTMAQIRAAVAELHEAGRVKRAAEPVWEPRAKRWAARWYVVRT